MSLRGLLVQRAILWRPGETRDQYGDVAATYALQGSVPLRITPPAGGLADYGAGEQAMDRQQAFLAPEAGLRERDVLEVTAGGGVGRRWRVLSVAQVNASGPAVHHLEAVVEPFHGEVP